MKKEKKKTENSRETKMYKLARKSSRLKHKQINLKKHIIIRVGHLPATVYELVNKQTKFTVVYVRLQPNF